MNRKKNAYSKALKGTSLFAGVQVFNILINILRSKIIALFLGPQGIGIFGLISSTMAFIGSMVGLGLNVSGVKELSALNIDTASEKRHETIAIIKKLLIFTGISGCMISIIFSKQLSLLTFGDDSYAFHFIFVSVSILFLQINTGNLVVFQGLRKLKQIAKSNLLSSFFGLICTAPLYYFFGLQAIVPAMIITPIIAFFISESLYLNLKIKVLPINFQKAFFKGLPMIKMGVIINMSFLLATGAAYLVQIFVNRIGGEVQVGLFIAGFAIINNYVGIIFSAMATDFYPRLAEVAKDNLLARETINQQAEIAILLLAPVLVIFFLFHESIILILYSDQFLEISPMLNWAALGMFFKAIGWPIAYLFLAKGTSKIYFWNEFTAVIYSLGANIGAYYFLGLYGLGISFLLIQILYFCQCYFVTRIKFNFRLESSLVNIFVIHFLIALICFISIQFADFFYLFKLIALLCLLATITFSFFELNKRINLTSKIRNFVKSING